MAITSELDKNFLSILNDDCIYQILDHLSLDDLCECSRTCHRLHTLCENQFRRKYPSKVSEEVRIGIGFDGKLRIQHIEYLRCFYNFVKTLKICVWDFGQNECKGKRLDLSPVTNFVQTKCDANLYKISIVGNIDLVRLCEDVAKFLYNVEIVQFISRTEIGQDEAKFLRHCPNVRRMILCNLSYVGNASENFDAILEQKYGQLKYFGFMYSDALSLNAEKLKFFFRSNDTIESLTLTFNLLIEDDQTSDRDDCIVKCIQSLDYATNLRCLFLSVGAPMTKSFGKICSHLNVLCERDSFRSLEIEFFREEGANLLKSHGTEMSDWKQLSKIHLKYIPLGDVLPALYPIHHVKTMVIRNPCFKYNSFKWPNINEVFALPQNPTLHQIEEIQIECMKCYDDDVLHYVQQFARHWTNLKRLLMPNNKIKLNVRELNRARKNLENACELSILTNPENNETNLECKMVKLKNVRFDRDDSPFQMYCLAF